MAWLTEEQLIQKSFKSLGQNVKISDKAALYNTELWQVGDNVSIDDFCVVSGKVSFGRNTHIAIFCNIAGGTEGITFDDFSGLAYGCHVFSQSDDYTGATLTNPTVPVIYKREKRENLHWQTLYCRNKLPYLPWCCNGRRLHLRRNIYANKIHRTMDYVFRHPSKKAKIEKKRSPWT